MSSLKQISGHNLKEELRCSFRPRKVRLVIVQNGISKASSISKCIIWIDKEQIQVQHQEINDMYITTISPEIVTIYKLYSSLNTK